MKNKKNCCFLGILFLVLVFGSCGNEEPQMILENGVEVVAPTEFSSGPEEPQKEDAGAKAAPLVIYVCGAVQNPGVYELEPEARVYQAIAAAGGLTEEADASRINQARTLVDGEQITVYREGEAPEADAPAAEDGRVNINTAGKEQLMTLNGVGESRAEAILQYREDHGKFEKIEDLMQVEGIKQKTWDKLKEQITVN